ncbi:GMC oxidoreductase, partial [Mesorhizobium sp.]|uniref:GMC oxidoreductase n=1 Tax=Mesorhizobium sp. TaxID=1871066 RepID=UPI0025801187
NVGKNMRDQYIVRTSHRTKGVLTVNEMNNIGTIAVETLKYMLFNRGLLTLGASMAALYVRSSPSVTFADLQLMFAPVSFSASVPGALETAGGMTIGTVLCCPDSTGSVLARSSNPNDAPAFDPNYLSDERDWPRLLVGLRVTQKMFGMDALKQWSAGETRPGKDVNTDAELFDYAKTVGSSSAVYTSTCQMGSRDSDVVDTLLRVRGISGLRIVDNSVLPSPVSGGMNATAIAVGERAADLILQAQ